MANCGYSYNGILVINFRKQQAIDIWMYHVFGWNSKTLCWAKEVTYKRSMILCSRTGKTNLRLHKSNRWLPRIQGEGLISQRASENYVRVTEMFSILFGWWLHRCLHLSSYTKHRKWVHLIMHIVHCIWLHICYSLIVLNFNSLCRQPSCE